MGKCESCYHEEMAKNYRWYVTSLHLRTSFYLLNYEFFLLVHPETLLIPHTVPIAVDITMLKMMKVVAWSVATHDGNIDRTKQLEQRDPEGEPCRAMMDPWARGTVPTKKEVIDPFMNLSGSNSGPPSIASRQPSRAPSDAGSYQSGKSRTVGSANTTKGGIPGRSKKEDNTPGKLLILSAK